MKRFIVAAFALVSLATPASADYIYGADWGWDRGAWRSCQCDGHDGCWRQHGHHRHAGMPSPYDFMAFRHYWQHHGCDFDPVWGGLPCKPAG